MWPNYSAVKDPGYAPSSKQQNYPTLFPPPPPALCRQKTGNHFFNKRFAPASPLPPHPSKGKGGRSLQLMENPEGLQKHADGTIGQLNGKIAELDQSRAGLNRSNRERPPWQLIPLLTIASHPVNGEANSTETARSWPSFREATKSGRTPTAPTWR